MTKQQVKRDCDRMTHIKHDCCRLANRVWQFIELAARGNTEMVELEAIADSLLESRCHEFQAVAALQTECEQFAGRPGGNCPRCGLIAYEHKVPLASAEPTAEEKRLRELLQEISDMAAPLPPELVNVISLKHSRDICYDIAQRAKESDGGGAND